MKKAKGGEEEQRARQTRIDPLKQQAFFDVHSEDWEHLSQEANHYMPFLVQVKIWKLMNTENLQRCGFFF